MDAQGDIRYRQIAGEIRNALSRGVYQTGERLPSLRQLCREHHVSLGTAVEAYGQLQDEGRVVARGRSGFYVAAPARNPLPPPRSPRRASRPTQVSISAMTLRVIDNMRRPGMVNLGAGTHFEGLQPVKTLSRSLSGAARRHEDELSVYSEVMGEMALRRQVAQMMTLAGVTDSPEDILITNGCQEAMNLSLQCVTAPGDTIAVETPAFFGMLQVAEALHLKVVEMPISYPRGVTPQTVRETVRQHPVKACVLTPSFNNPLGVVMPDEDKRDVVQFLSGQRIPLIEDDIVGFLSFTKPRPRAALASDLSGNTLLCSSFSKTLAPGLRLGWLHAGRFAETARKRKFLANITTASLPQLALAAYLKRKVFQREMGRFTDRLQRLMLTMQRDIQDFFPKGTRVSNPQGGLYLWLELPDRLDSEVLYLRCLERGISILPGLLFSPSGLYRSHIRLTFASVPSDISRAAIRTLASLLPGLPTVRTGR